MLNSVKHFKNQYVSALVAGMTMLVAGATFVWVTPIIPYLDGPDAIILMNPTEISWMVSLVEVGSAFAPIISGIISECWGRKISILLAGPFIIIGWVLILVTRDVFSLYIVRLLHGFGMGVLFTIVPIYLGEIAAVKVRGGLTSLLQTLWYSGFLFQYNIGSYLSYQNSALINLIISIIVFTFFYFLPPETPFFLMIKNREHSASRNLMLLRGKRFEESVSSELQIIKECVSKDMKNKSHWTDVFHLSWVDYKIIILVQLISIFRLCSGTISFAAYINDLLRRAGWEALSPELIMTIYGSVTLTTVVIATLIVDFVGRRPLLIISCIGATITNLVLGCYYYIDEFNKEIDLESIRWIPATTLILFTTFFGIGLGPVTQTLQSELFPTNIRALGNILTSHNLTITSFICLRFYQIVVDYIGVYANFLFFALNSITAAIVIYVYIPETKGKTFLEIKEFFTKENTTNQGKVNDLRF